MLHVRRTERKRMSPYQCRVHDIQIYSVAAEKTAVRVPLFNECKMKCLHSYLRTGAHAEQVWNFKCYDNESGSSMYVSNCTTSELNKSSQLKNNYMESAHSSTLHAHF
jgi:hypothetical protein